jgi:proteic killer suppression protein
VIISFGDRAAEALFLDRPAARLRRLPREIRVVAKRKLLQLAASVDLKDLAVPPGNRLEALAGDLKGLHSIRINDQWRIVFRWSTPHAYEVRIVDYH